MLAGTYMLVSDEQLENAKNFIVFNPSGRLTLEREEQP